MIAIGGLGGSGTSAVAQVLIDAGVYMGDDLNMQNDNLLFTRLFKKPIWYKTANTEDKNNRLKVFEKCMQSSCLNFEDLKLIFTATRMSPIYNSKLNFYLKILKKAWLKKELHSNWGWKEPNTQIYVSEILNCFSNLKYVHVLRNGLDMAFSQNKQQLKNWGWKYNIIISGKENRTELAVKQLDFWIESTKDVLSKMGEFDESRCLIIKHDNFCSSPLEEVRKLLNFIGIKTSSTELEILSRIPMNVETNNRFKNEDLGIFDRSKLNFVNDLGFEI